jgi:hypothetical protein
MDNITSSKLVCLDLVMWINLKLKSCKVLIHLPFLPYVFAIVTNHSDGLWSVHNVKSFQYKYYLKCTMPHTRA